MNTETPENRCERLPVLFLSVDLDGCETLRLPVERLILIGRSSSNDLVLDDPTISRCHASLRHEDGVLIIRDLGSRNGTLVRGVKIGEVLVLPGESFIVGNARCTVEQAPHLLESSAPGFTTHRLSSLADRPSLSDRDEQTADPNPRKH